MFHLLFFLCSDVGFCCTTENGLERIILKFKIQMYRNHNLQTPNKWFVG